MQAETDAPDALDDYKKYDSPDLWVKFQTAKERLHTETNFLIKYRASSPREATGLTGTDCTGAELEWDVSVVASVKLPTVNPARWTAAAQSNQHDNLPPSQQEPSSQDQDQKPESPPIPDSSLKALVRVAHPSIALYIAPHLRDPALQPLRSPQSHGPLQRSRTSCPFRAIPVRSESKQRQASSESQSHSPSLSPVVTQDTTLHKDNRMSDTGSDEIMLTRGNKFRGRQQKSSYQVESSHTERDTRKNSIDRKSSKLQPDSNSPSEQQENMQPRETLGSPSSAADKAKQEDMEELQRLREAIVQKAHLNRFKHLDCDTASPEALVICRKGPGTDQNSDFYQVMASRRRAGKITTVIEKPKPSSSSDASSDTEKEEEKVKPHFVAAFKSHAEFKKHAAQWDAYVKSPHIYPTVKDKKVHLSQTPTEEHKRIEELISLGGLDPAYAEIDENLPRPGNKWADSLHVDWQYRPRASSSLEAFRDWFRRWLDTITHICRHADIFHEDFFDGTAHPDGVRILYTPDQEDDEIFLDTSDEMTMLHAHETAEGYCHNWVLHSRKQQQQEQMRKELSRQAYLEAMRAPPRENPNSPKANIYLRPAQLDDSQGILRIMNWYAKTSTLSTDVQPLETGDVRQRIENCQENQLPFIVAVGRRSGPARDEHEGIVGYALANDTVGLNTSGRYTAELHVFVDNGHTRQGIGRCLIDKLLEVCDPTYIPKFGYSFNATFDEQPRFHQGGCRRLARLIFAVGYRPDRQAEVEWVKEWLFEKYEFEEQAVLKGARVKFDHFNDVSYLVRTVGHSPIIRFEY